MYTPQTLRLVLVAIAILTVGIVVFWGYNKYALTEVRSIGGTYTEGIIGAPRFINPVLAQSNADKDLTELVFGSLIDVDQQGNISYHIADSLRVSSDQKTYTLNINPEARFSDGTYIDAQDIVFTINKIQNSTIKSPLFNKWAGIEVNAQSAREVSFTLSQPYADFIYNLTIGVLPEHIWEQVPDNEFIFNIHNIQPIGSGFYRYEDITYARDGAPERYELVPNRYSSSLPFISKIIINIYKDSEELLDAYEKNNIDGAYGISSSYLQEHEFEYIHTGSLPRSFAIFFNTENNKSTLDSETRTALSYAIDREQIIQEVFAGNANTIDGPIDDSQLNISFDIEKALEGLREAGWKQNSEGIFMKSISGRNTPLSFTLSVPDINDIFDVAVIIKNNLAEIGVTIDIVSFQQAELTNEVIRSRDFDALLFGYVLEKPSDTFAFWHSSQKNDPGLNISVYSDSRADAALSNIRNQQERDDDIENFLEQWRKDSPAIFLYSPNYVYVSPQHFTISKNITNSSDRFNAVNEWYLTTRHVWNFLISNDE